MAKQKGVTSTGNQAPTNVGIAAAADLQKVWSAFKSGATVRDEALENFSTNVGNIFDQCAAIGAKYGLANEEMCNVVLASALGADAESKSCRKAKSEMRVALRCGATGQWEAAKAAVDAAKAGGADIHSRNRKDKTLTAARKLLEGKNAAEVIQSFTVEPATTIQDKSVNKLVKAVESSKGDGPAVAALLAEFKATWRKLVALPDVSASTVTAPAATVPAAQPAQAQPVVDFATIWQNMAPADRASALAAMMGAKS